MRIRQISKSTDNTTIAIGIGLVALLLSIVSIGISTTGNGSSCPGGAAAVSAPSPCWTQVQSSFFTCTIAINTPSCSITKIFSPSYPVKPYIAENINGTPTGALFSKAFSQGPEQFVFQAYPSVTWSNIPLALTELNNQASQEIDWQTTLTFTQENWKFCVNIVTISAGSVSMFPQFSSDGGVTWTTMGDVNFAVNVLLGPGRLCGAQENVLLPQTAIMRVVETGGGGAGDNPVFGLIELSLGTGIFNISIPNPCNPTFTGLSTTQVTLTYRCNFNVLTAVTITLDWWAGIPG